MNLPTLIKHPIILSILTFSFIGFAIHQQVNREIAESVEIEAPLAKLREAMLAHDTPLHTKPSITHVTLTEKTPVDPTTIPRSTVSDKELVNSKDFQCLAKNIYHEAGIESLKGKLAVATVTMNRVDAKVRGTTICEVVYAPKQFSWTNVKRLVDEAPRGKLWEESKEVALATLKGKRSKKIGKDVYHYHAHYANPHAIKWKENLEYVARIDTHLFYAGK